MNLTKGHNNLTKLNEKTSCICGRFSILNNIWPWIGILLTGEEPCCNFFFLIIYKRISKYFSRKS